MTYLVWTLLIILFVYAFQGLLAFLPWLVWYMYWIVFFPVEIINQVIYPVWWIVYTIYIWLAMFVLARIIVNFYHKHS